jgi:protein gp37
MSATSTIEWTDATWNPVRGCTKISPGCTHCYAEKFAERFRGVAGHPYEQGFDLRLVPEKLAEPLRWSAPKTIFVNSMSDLFHVGVPESYILRVARVMQAAPWHTFQVLTKRAARLREMLTGSLAFAGALEHVWWGVSVEDKKYGVPRIDHLRKSPASLRFLSVEPLLEDLGELNLAGIHWVIVGGESGPGARPMKKQWVSSIRDQCLAAGVKSSLSSGAVSTRPSMAGFWKAGPMTSCPHGPAAQFSRSLGAFPRSNDSGIRARSAGRRRVSHRAPLERRRGNVWQQAIETRDATILGHQPNCILPPPPLPLPPSSPLQWLRTVHPTKPPPLKRRRLVTSPPLPPPAMHLL